MAGSQKTRLGIVFGGKSGEHEVSLTSAASVMSALSPDEYEVIPIGITKTGKLAGPVELKAMLPKSLLDSLHGNPKMIDGLEVEKALSLSEKNNSSTN